MREAAAARAPGGAAGGGERGGRPESGGRAPWDAGALACGGFPRAAAGPWGAEPPRPGPACALLPPVPFVSSVLVPRRHLTPRGERLDVDEGAQGCGLGLGMQRDSQM